MIDVVRKAAKAVGSVRRLAKKLDVYRGSLYQWEKVPAERVLEIEQATGGKVTRYEMRPDIHGRKATANEQRSKKTADA